jgi:hypothetical protein
VKETIKYYSDTSKKAKKTRPLPKTRPPPRMAYYSGDDTHMPTSSSNGGMATTAQTQAQASSSSSVSGSRSGSGSTPSMNTEPKAALESKQNAFGGGIKKKKTADKRTVSMSPK